MVDRPRDRPHVERPTSGSPTSVSPTGGPSGANGREPNAAAEASGEIGARDVIAYLRRHPDFLEKHPEALRLLRAPSRELGEGVFDFQHFHVERLRQDLARLNLEHRTLIAASRGTLASQGRVHKAVLAILAAGSFEQLLQTVTTDMAVLLDVDIVTIGVESTTSAGGRLSIQGIHLLTGGRDRRAARPRARAVAARRPAGRDRIVRRRRRAGAVAGAAAPRFRPRRAARAAVHRHAASPADSTRASAPSC